MGARKIEGETVLKKQALTLAKQLFRPKVYIRKYSPHRLEVRYAAGSKNPNGTIRGEIEASNLKDLIEKMTGLLEGLKS